MFTKRSKSLERAKSPSPIAVENPDDSDTAILVTDNQEKDDVRISEYEALIDTLTQKLANFEEREAALQQEHKTKENLQENVINTLEEKLQQSKYQLQNAEEMNEQHIRNADILQDLELKVREYRTKDDLKESIIDTLERKNKVLSAQLESSKQHQETLLAAHDAETIEALKNMEKKVKYLSTELEGKQSQLQNQRDLAESRNRSAVPLPVAQSFADPKSLLAARKLLKEVSHEFPKLTPDTQHLFLFEARQFTKNYMMDWSNAELQKDVFLTLLGAAHPEKKNTLQRLKDEASTPDSFLVAIATHYGDRTNYLVDEESFHNKSIMGSFLLAKDYGGWIDHLRAMSDRYLDHLSELEKERAVLKAHHKDNLKGFYRETTERAYIKA